VLEGEAYSIWKNTDKDKASVELEFEACLSHAAGPFPVHRTYHVWPGEEL
jgi:hypothetical protein